MAFPAWLVVQFWLMGTSIALLRRVGKLQPLAVEQARFRIGKPHAQR